MRWLLLLALALPGCRVSEPPSVEEPKKVLDQVKVCNETVDWIERLYMYRDFGGPRWAPRVAQARARVKAGMTPADFYAEMRLLVRALGDDHSSFQSPDEVERNFRSNLGSRVVGIGANVRELNGGAVILYVLPNSPAARAGLKARDLLVTADGRPLLEEGGFRTERLLGAAGTNMTLEVQSLGQPVRKITLTRAAVPSSQVPIDAHLVSQKPRIGYIFLPAFEAAALPRQVSDALQQWGKLDGLILDNRVNGGGQLHVIRGVLAPFMSGRVGDFVTRSRRPLEIKPKPVHNSQTVPLVVLVGADTASYGEVSSGVLRELRHARLVGQLTPGNVEMLHVCALSDGSELRIAEGRFEPALSKADWEATGLKPDVVVAKKWREMSADNDEAVKVAVRLLSHP